MVAQPDGWPFKGMSRFSLKFLTKFPGWIIALFFITGTFSSHAQSSSTDYCTLLLLGNNPSRILPGHPVWFFYHGKLISENAYLLGLVQNGDGSQPSVSFYDAINQRRFEMSANEVKFWHQTMVHKFPSLNSPQLFDPLAKKIDRIALLMRF